MTAAVATIADVHLLSDDIPEVPAAQIQPPPVAAVKAPAPPTTPPAKTMSAADAALLRSRYEGLLEHVHGDKVQEEQLRSLLAQLPAEPAKTPAPIKTLDPLFNKILEQKRQEPEPARAVAPPVPAAMPAPPAPVTTVMPALDLLNLPKATYMEALDQQAGTTNQPNQLQPITDYEPAEPEARKSYSPSQQRMCS